MTSSARGSNCSGAANGGQALLQRWSRKLLSGKSIFRIYWPAMLLVVAGFIVYVFNDYYSATSFGRAYLGNFFWYPFILISLFILNFIVRMQLACIPAMASLPDFDRMRWPSLRTTPISTGEIFRVLLLHTLKYNVLLLGVLGFLGEIMVADLDSASGISVSMEFFYAAVGYSAVGLSLSGLGYIASMKWDKPIAVVGGVFAPVIILVFVGTAMFMHTSLEHSINDPLGWLYIVDILAMLVAPEGFIYSWLEMGEVSTPSGMEMSIAAWMSTEILIAIIIWQFVGITLTIKRAADK